MLEIKINESEGSAKIVVVGVGGAGNNAVTVSYTHLIIKNSHMIFIQESDS